MPKISRTNSQWVASVPTRHDKSSNPNFIQQTMMEESEVLETEKQRFEAAKRWMEEKLLEDRKDIYKVVKRLRFNSTRNTALRSERSDSLATMSRGKTDIWVCLRIELTNWSFRSQKTIKGKVCSGQHWWVAMKFRFKPLKLKENKPKMWRKVTSSSSWNQKKLFSLTWPRNVHLFRFLGSSNSFELESRLHLKLIHFPAVKLVPKLPPQTHPARAFKSFN